MEQVNGGSFSGDGRYIVNKNKSDMKKVCSNKEKVLILLLTIAIIATIVGITIGIVLFGKVSSLPNNENGKQHTKWLNKSPAQQIQSLNTTIAKLIKHFNLRDSTSTLMTSSECTVYRSHSSKTFCLSEKFMIFSKAKAFCEKLGGQLATETIRNITELEIIMDKLLLPATPRTVWIGLEDAAKNGTWRYMDGVLATQENTEWERNQTDNANNIEYCGALDMSWDYEYNYYYDEYDYEYDDTTLESYGIEGKLCTRSNRAFCEAKIKVINFF